MADNAALDQLWRSQGNTGDRPVGWFGSGGSAERPNYGNGSGGGSDPIADAQRLRQFNIESNQPAIQSFQAAIPEVQQKFNAEKARLEGEKTPLKDRYSNIINQLKGREQKETSQVQTNLSQEYGKRGVPLSSGIFQTDLTGKTNDLSQFYGGQIANVGLEQEAGLRGLDQLIANLTGQETEQTRAIQNAIAQLQAGDPSNAISGALSMLQQRQQADQFNKQQTFQEQQAAQQNKLAESQFAFEQQAQPYQLALLQAQARKANQPSYRSASDLSAVFD